MTAFDDGLALGLALGVAVGIIIDRLVIPVGMWLGDRLTLVRHRRGRDGR